MLKRSPHPPAQFHTRLFFYVRPKKSLFLFFSLRAISIALGETHTHTQREHNFVTLSNFLLKMAPRGTISWWRFLDVIENIFVSLLWIFNEFCSSFPLFVRLKNIRAAWAFAVCINVGTRSINEIVNNFSIIVMFFGKNRFQFQKIFQNCVCTQCVLCVSYFNKWSTTTAAASAIRMKARWSLDSWLIQQNVQQFSIEIILYGTKNLLPTEKYAKHSQYDEINQSLGKRRRKSRRRKMKKRWRFNRYWEFFRKVNQILRSWHEQFVLFFLCKEKFEFTKNMRIYCHTHIVCVRKSCGKIGQFN